MTAVLYKTTDDFVIVNTPDPPTPRPPEGSDPNPPKPPKPPSDPPPPPDDGDPRTREDLVYEFYGDTNGDGRLDAVFFVFRDGHIESYPM